jgi:Zn-dependent protease with chaperone function
MAQAYPAGPTAVPESLTRPTSSYKTHAWLAMGGLLLFVAAYFALAGWFSWTAWRLLASVYHGGSQDAGRSAIIGVGCAFLAVFMLKALFFVRHRYEIDDIEIKATEQPRLFEFLNRLADEAKAPRPHRVFLSPRVNAAVSYDLSILNLLIPSKKNLEIGLGLVNALTLGEMKAVLAHEFGHFAQRSMAVGRWVYIAQQIAGGIIARRDALDSFLQGLSRIDIRIAWIGWLLSLIVWSIRSVMETVFRIVVLAQRALSREMEFQADLVAVSLTGSDALIHALHRLHSADDAWDRALGFAAAEARGGRAVQDVFALQTQVIERLRTILDDPQYEDVKPVPTERPGEHRLFRKGVAQAPRMWATHPTNAEREDNAKRTYVPAEVDGRAAWDLFDDVAGLRQRMSAHVIRSLETEPVALEQSQEKLDQQFKRAYLDRRYRGAYLGRSLVRHAKDVRELYNAPLEPELITAELERLYPETLGQDLSQMRTLQEEIVALRALADGFADAPGGIIRHRGRELKRRDLPNEIEKVEEELEAARERVHAHDRRCRSTHLAAAQALGKGWSEYLSGLLGLIHYAEHAEADLRDAQGAMWNVYQIVTADGRVSSSERMRLITAGQTLYQILERIHREAGGVVLDPVLLKRLETTSFETLLGTLTLPPLSQENIGQWLKAVDSWVHGAANVLDAIELAALDQLLICEGHVAKFSRELATAASAAPVAPAASVVPASYPVFLPGAERKRQRKLGLWDRFQVADGLFATLARLAVAGGIVGVVIIFGAGTDTLKLDLYNGLDRSVQVDVGDERVALDPHERTRIELGNSDEMTITATTADGKVIETFSTDPDAGYSHFVYNVAGAAPMIEWTAVYTSSGAGSGSSAARPLGNSRWLTATSDYVFEDPPEKLETHEGDSRTVLVAYDDPRPAAQLAELQTDKTRAELIGAHARWDDAHSASILDWLALAASQSGGAEIIAARIADDPHDIASLRMEQELGRADGSRARVCERHTAEHLRAPEDGDFAYLAARCIEDAGQQERAFREAYAAHPDNGWIAFAVGYDRTSHGKWRDALQPYQNARVREPALRGESATVLARLKRVLDGQVSEASVAAVEAKLSVAQTFNAPVKESGGMGDADLARDSEQFAQAEAFARPEKDGSSLLLAYAALNRGDLDTAVKAASDSSVDLASRARVVRLAAASDGAWSQIVQSARDIGATQPLDAESAIAMLGLALRDGSDTSAYLEHLRTDAASTDPALLQCIEALRSHANDSNLDSLLDGAGIMTRAHCYSLATIALGKRTPPAWRAGASKLLFVTERPYFGS